MDFFGFEFKKKAKDDQPLPSVVSPPTADGSIVVDSPYNGLANAGGYFSYGVDLEGVVKNDNELIRRYREISLFPEVDFAINDICNEAIVSDQEEKIVSLNLDELKTSDQIKKKMSDCFDEVLSLLDFNNVGAERFRQWYVDGKIYYHIMFKDNSPRNGISEIRLIDPLKIKKIKNIKREKLPTGVEVIKGIEEYYIYNDKGIHESSMNGIKLTLDSVVEVTSGLIDGASGSILSYLQKTIKPANQLKMMEDALVIYRMSRAPERRIFYIDVGSMPKIKAEQYVEDMMKKFRNKLVYDAKTGELTDSKKHLCLAMDTKVPLLDGRTLTLSEIEKEYKDKELWAYSCDPMTGKFTPGLITWAGVSNPNAKVMRITLDNGETITCTPEHRFPVWNKGLVAASELAVGESMIPYYERTATIGRKGEEGKISTKGKDYHQIFSNDKQKWVYTHREVSEWKDSNGIENEFIFKEEYAAQGLYVVHHKDINRFNNSPDNLTRMNSKDHIAWHRSSGSKSGKVGGKKCYEMGTGVHNKSHPDYFAWHQKAGRIGGRISSDIGVSQQSYAYGREIFAEFMKDESYNSWFRNQQRKGWTIEKRNIASQHAVRNNLSKRGNDVQKEQWKTEERKSKFKNMYLTEYSESMFSIVDLSAKQKLSAEKVSKLLTTPELITEFKELNKDKCISNKQKSYEEFNRSDVDRITKQFSNFKSYQELKESIVYRNHKISKIEYLEERMDTGCLTIDGNEIYHNHHTFALAAGIYTENSMMEDFWMPRRDSGKGTEITTLPGGQNLGQIDDIQYFLNKLYRSLNVPITRLQPETGFTIGRSNEISREEVRFSKFIDKLRSKFSNLFLDILKIQLITKGIVDVNDWKDISQKIKFDYSRDNFFTELKETEILNNRLQALTQVDPYIGKYFSRKTVLKKILRMTDEEINNMEKENSEDPFLKQEADTQEGEQ